MPGYNTSSNRRSSYKPSSFDDNWGGGPYDNFGSSVPRKSNNNSLPYGGKRSKMKGKKSRKMKGGLWPWDKNYVNQYDDDDVGGGFFDGPPPSMSSSQGSLTNQMSREEQRRRYSELSRNMNQPGMIPQGGGSGSYTDGASYGMYVNGTGGSQWTRTMDQGGPYGGVPGNTIIGAQGQNIQPTSQMPTQSNLALIQKAGGKRRRGGFLGEVINQAIVPFSILGMQQTYRRKKGGKRGTRKNCKHRKH